VWLAERWTSKQRGQTTSEIGLVLLFIFLACFVMVVLFAADVEAFYTDQVSQLSSAMSR
jgi:hypothetical protein